MIAYAQHDDHSGHEQDDHHEEAHHDGEHGDNNGHAHDAECGEHDHQHGPYDPKATAMHHIADANVYTILDFVRIPLPCILYSKETGWDVFMSSKFGPGHHDDGHYAYNGYVLHEGSVMKVIEPGFPAVGKHEVGGFSSDHGADKTQHFVCYQGEPQLLEAKTVWDGGILGGGVTSFYDFSMTKNVVSMILVSLLLFFLFRSAARGYAVREGGAPKGAQSLLEPVVTYIRDEVAIPFIGEKQYMKFLPLLLSMFFFILGLNLWGQVPFLGGTNVTGSLTLTAILAIIVFLVSNFNGNRHYWQHIFWMPGVPVFVKPLLAFIELLSLFIKPLTLMLRLAGNISAGHIAIISFIGLIFIFGNSGESLGGGVVGSVLSTLLTMFMMAIELIVAFVQAFVFTLLSASYIGTAVEEHEHH
ncbi:MAG: F0F1 ATP synthase subunit A [Bacteroidota bacterium]